jgi:hypothetical protein
MLKQKEDVKRTIELASSMVRFPSEWTPPLDPVTQTVISLPTICKPKLMIEWRTREEQLEWFADAFPSSPDEWDDYFDERLALPQSRYQTLVSDARKRHQDQLNSIKDQLVSISVKLRPLISSHATGDDYAIHQTVCCEKQRSDAKTLELCLSALAEKHLRGGSPVASDPAISFAVSCSYFCSEWMDYAYSRPLNLLDRIERVQHELATLYRSCLHTSSLPATKGLKWTVTTRAMYTTLRDSFQSSTVGQIYKWLHDQIDRWTRHSETRFWAMISKQVRKDPHTCIELAKKEFEWTSEQSPFRKRLIRFCEWKKEKEDKDLETQCKEWSQKTSKYHTDVEVKRCHTQLDKKWEQLVRTYMVIHDPTHQRTIRSVMAEHNWKPNQPDETIQWKGLTLFNITHCDDDREEMKREFFKLNWNQLTKHGVRLGQLTHVYDTVVRHQRQNSGSSPDAILREVELDPRGYKKEFEEQRRLNHEHIRLTELKKELEHRLTQETQFRYEEQDRLSMKKVCFSQSDCKTGFDQSTRLCVLVAQIEVSAAYRKVAVELIEKIAVYEWNQVKNYRTLLIQFRMDPKKTLPRTDFNHTVLRNVPLPYDTLLTHILDPLVRCGVLLQHHGQRKYRHHNDLLSSGDTKQDMQVREYGWTLNRISLCLSVQERLKLIFEKNMKVSHTSAVYRELLTTTLNAERLVTDLHSMNSELIKQRIQVVDEDKYKTTLSMERQQHREVTKQYTLAKLGNAHLYPVISIPKYKTTLTEWNRLRLISQFLFSLSLGKWDGCILSYYV